MWFTNGTRCEPCHSVKGRRGTEELMPMPLSLVHQTHEGRASDTRPAPCVISPSLSRFSRREGEAPSSAGERKAGSSFSPHLSRDTAARCADTRKREARINSLFLAYVTWTEDGFSYHLPSCFFSSKEDLVPRSPSPLFPPNQEPRPSTSREQCQVEKEEEGVEVSLEDDAGSPDSSSNFTEMMEFVCTRFPEARAPSAQAVAPFFPGLQKEVRPSAPQLKRTQAVDFKMQRASSDLARANESTKLSFLKYPATRYYKAYKIGDDNGRTKAAKINPDLSHLLVGQGEPSHFFSGGND